ADDGKLAGEQIVLGQVVQSRDQLAFGQISAGPEDDHHARIRGAMLRLLKLPQQIGLIHGPRPFERTKLTGAPSRPARENTRVRARPNGASVWSDELGIIRPLRESADSALRQGAQRLATLTDADQVTATYSLPFAGVNHRGFSNQKLAECRTNVVDLELRRNNCRAQGAATGEG